MMMKKYITTIIFLLITLASVLAQSPEMFSYQTILRDNNGVAVANQNVTIDVSILLDSETGTELFTESHSLTTTGSGLLNLTIGSVNDLSVVNWAQGKHFLKLSWNGNTVETKELLDVPFSNYAKRSAAADSADYNNLTNLPDFSAWDKNASDDFDGKYSSFLMWQEDNYNLYYNKGKVSIKNQEPVTFAGEVLRVNGAILYNGGATDTVPGVLYYDPAGNGSFRYFNNNGEMKVIGTGTITFNNPDPAVGDVVVYSDAKWKNRVCLGNGGHPGYDFGDNVFVLASDTLRIYFFDTSTSGSFPSNDWKMVFNDLQLGGDSYFAIFDSTYRTTPFKLMAGATNHSLFVDENSNMGIGNTHPTEKLEVTDNVSATHFIGNGSSLTGLLGVTSTVENTGTTTIAADSDADNVGQIEFQTQGTTKLLIDNDGKVIVGSSVPSVEFDAEGKNAKFNSLEVSGNVSFASITCSVSNVTDPGSTSLNYDVANKRTIIFNSSIGAISITGFQNGVLGQKITIVNTNAAAPITIQSFPNVTTTLHPGFATYTLNQYESISYVYTNTPYGVMWQCQELVKAP